MPRRSIRSIRSTIILLAMLGCGCDDLSSLPERVLRQTDQVALKEGLRAAEEAGRIAPLDENAITDGPALSGILQRALHGARSELGPLTLTLTGRYGVESPGSPLPEIATRTPDAGVPDAGEDVPPAADEERRAPRLPIQIQETRTLRLGPNGTFALDHISLAGGGDLAFQEDGRRCIWLDDMFYAGHRHGPMTRVPPIADEHHRCEDGALEPIRTFVRLLAERIEVSVKGVDVIEGRDVITVALGVRDPGHDPPDLPKTWGEDGMTEGDSPAIFGLRAPLMVGYTRLEKLEGTLSLDTITGQPLGGQLAARLPFTKAGRSAILVVELTLTTTALTEPIAAPEEPRIYGPRVRIFDEQRRLLGQKKVPAKAPALPAPGDAPKLTVGPQGELRSGTPEDTPTEPAVDEDAPVEPARPTALPRPTAPDYDEDRPE